MPKKSQWRTFRFDSVHILWVFWWQPISFSAEGYLVSFSALSFNALFVLLSHCIELGVRSNVNVFRQRFMVLMLFTYTVNASICVQFVSLVCCCLFQVFRFSCGHKSEESDQWQCHHARMRKHRTLTLLFLDYHFQYRDGYRNVVCAGCVQCQSNSFYEKTILVIQSTLLKWSEVISSTS